MSKSKPVAIEKQPSYGTVYIPGLGRLSLTNGFLTFTPEKID